MDAEVKPTHERWGIAATAFAPLIPQVLGSIFNIWYNVAVIDPLLHSAALKQRFVNTVIFYNTTIYPLAVVAWLWLVFSLRKPFRDLLAGHTVDPARLTHLRRRVVNLPWAGALIAAIGWLLCIPVFLISLSTAGDALDPTLYWHFPISIIVSTVIAVTHSFFLVEVASHWGLFPVFFRNSRADRLEGGWALSLRGRGILWAISAGICPIGSLLLLDFAPPAPHLDHRWFAVFVGLVGIAFGICTALMIGRLVARPVDRLRLAANEVGKGRLDVQVHEPRPDEFGVLIAEFNQMIDQLREKERLRQTFGLHVGHAAAEQILARDPGLGGAEQIITVMFVDIRSFTSRSAARPAPETVAELNQFLRVMVEVVEQRHGGMINKFLGDGFMALFGVENASDDHAGRAVRAGRDMLAALDTLNRAAAAPFHVGIGVHTGEAIVGSIGSPQRLEFTAIGSTVNIAARIEQLTKALQVPLLISHATVERLGDRTGLVALPPQPIRGIDEPVPLFRVETA